MKAVLEKSLSTSAFEMSVTLDTPKGERLFDRRMPRTRQRNVVKAAIEISAINSEIAATHWRRPARGATNPESVALSEDQGK